MKKASYLIHLSSDYQAVTKCPQCENIISKKIGERIDLSGTKIKCLICGCEFELKKTENIQKEVKE